MHQESREWRVRLTVSDDETGRHFGWTVLQEDAPGKWKEVASGSSSSWEASSGSFGRILAAAYEGRNRHPSALRVVKERHCGHLLPLWDCPVCGIRVERQP